MSEAGSMASINPDVDKIVRLFQGPNSQDLHERHVAAIERLCKSSAGGFAIRDLPKIQQVLEVTFRLVQQGLVLFVEPVHQLIRALGRPYTKRTSTDELKLFSTITAVFATLGQLFEQDFPQLLQQAAAEVLAEFSTAYNNRPSTLDLQRSQDEQQQDLQAAAALRTYHMHQSLILRSGAACSVVTALHRAVTPKHTSTSSTPAFNGTTASTSTTSGTTTSSGSSSSGLVASLTQALLDFSFCPELGAQMLQTGLLPALVALLQHLQGCSSSYSSGGGVLLSHALELLWNLMEHCPEAAVKVLDTAVTKPRAAQPRPKFVMGDNNEASVSASGFKPGTPAHGKPNAKRKGSPAHQQGQQGVRQSRQAQQQQQEEGNEEEQEEEQQQGQDSSGTQQQQPESSNSPSRNASEDGGRRSVLGQAARLSDSAAAAAAAAEGAGSGVAVAAQLVECLGRLFSHLVLHAASKQEQDTRNDVLAILQLLVSSSTACATAISGSSMLQPALAAATTPELRPYSPLVKVGPPNGPGEAHELEMKQLLLSIMVASCCAKGSCCLSSCLEAGLLQVLLTYAGSDVGAGGQELAARWNRDQLAFMRSLAWSLLQQLAPICKSDFDAAGGLGSTVLALVGSPTPEPALRVLHTLCSGDRALAEGFAHQGALAAVLQLVSEPRSSEGLRQTSLQALAALCDGSKANQRRLREGRGTEVLLQEGQRLAAADPSLPSTHSLALMGALWSCVLPDARSRAQWLAQDGLDGLLSVLERGNPHNRPVVVTLLADLLSDPKSHPFFHEWRASDRTTTSAQLLIAMWRQQDGLRCMTDKDGLLACPERPLAGCNGTQNAWAIGAGGGGSGGGAAGGGGSGAAAATAGGGFGSGRVAAGVGGVYGNLQPARRALLESIAGGCSGDDVLAKVYTCLRLVGFSSLSYLPAADSAVLLVIEQYTRFRQGEVWADIRSEFERQGVATTEEDATRLSSGIQMAEALAQSVRSAQAALLAERTQALTLAEHALYESLRQQAAAEADAKRYQKDGSKLTMRERLAAKARREEMLKASLAAHEGLGSLGGAAEGAGGGVDGGSSGSGGGGRLGNGVRSGSSTARSSKASSRRVSRASVRASVA